MLFVPILIDEDIVGDGFTDRAAVADMRSQQGMSHDDRLRALSNGDAQGGVLPSVPKGDKTVLRVGADEERQAAELLRPNRGCFLLCQESYSCIIKSLEVERGILIHLSPPVGLNLAPYTNL